MPSPWLDHTDDLRAAAERLLHDLTELGVPTTMMRTHSDASTCHVSVAVGGVTHQVRRASGSGTGWLIDGKFRESPSRLLAALGVYSAPLITVRGLDEAGQPVGAAVHLPWDGTPVDRIRITRDDLLASDPGLASTGVPHHVRIEVTRPTDGGAWFEHVGAATLVVPDAGPLQGPAEYDRWPGRCWPAQLLRAVADVIEDQGVNLGGWPYEGGVDPVEAARWVCSDWRRHEIPAHYPPLERGWTTEHVVAEMREHADRLDDMED